MGSMQMAAGVAIGLTIATPLMQPDSFIHWARSQAIALPRVDSLDALPDDALRKMVGAARVVAIGEPAHGAHEPLALRNRLFQYFVEQLGFSAVVLESGLGEARRVNDFVLGRAGDLGDAQEIARGCLTWGFGKYAENVELLRWMRRYNDDPAHTRKVRFYGIDLTGGDAGEYRSSRISLDEALGYLAHVAPDSHRRVHGALAPFLRKFTRPEHLTLSPDEHQRLTASIDSMIATFEYERSALIAASSQESYEWAYRSAISAHQVDEFFRLWPSEPKRDGVSPRFYDAAVARDAAMAENLRWVLQREATGRVLVFAHNVHLVNAPLRGGLWAVYPRAPMVMGQHLRAALREDLLVIVISSTRNGPGLPGAPRDPDSLDAALAQVGPAQFLLDIRPARSLAAVAPWLSQDRPMRANFTTEVVLPPLQSLDALIFIDALTPAR